VRVEVDQDKARALGITSLDVERRCKLLSMGCRSLAIARRIACWTSLPASARRAGQPRSSLADQSGDAFGTDRAAVAGCAPRSRVRAAELNRRSACRRSRFRRTGRCAACGNRHHARDQLDAIRPIAAGAAMQFGGSIEESANSQASVFKQVPVALLLILVLLIIQLQDNRKLLLVVLTGRSR
jgi:multidrug efflux pump